MSNITILARDISISVRNDNGEQVLGFNIPFYELEVAPERLLRLIDNINKLVTPTNDETPPKTDEAYYMVSENGIDVETWGDNALDKANWASGRATKDINKAAEMFKSLCLPS